MSNFLSTASSYIVARVTTAIVKDGPHSIDFAKGRQNLKALAKYDWYKELKAQYERNWDYHPMIIDMMSYVDLQELETEQGISKFKENLKIQLAILNWE